MLAKREDRRAKGTHSAEPPRTRTNESACRGASPPRTRCTWSPSRRTKATPGTRGEDARSYRTAKEGTQRNTEGSAHRDTYGGANDVVWSRGREIAREECRRGVGVGMKEGLQDRVTRPSCELHDHRPLGRGSGRRRGRRDRSGHAIALPHSARPRSRLPLLGGGRRSNGGRAAHGRIHGCFGDGRVALLSLLGSRRRRRGWLARRSGRGHGEPGGHWKRK